MIPAELDKHMKSAPVDVLAAARELGLEIFSTELPDKISGVLLRDPSYKSKSEFVILVNKDEPAYRQRFTAAHELGHFVLHRDSIGDRVEDSVLFRSVGVSNHQEKEANDFAASLLIPLDLVSSVLEEGTTSTISDLAERFKVSDTTMKIRLGLPT